MRPGVEVERTLLGLVTSAHVACGGHAGDEDSMRATVRRRVGTTTSGWVPIPSYPDRAGFGRQPMEIDRAELGTSLSDAGAGTRPGLRRGRRTRVESVKAHGALYGEVAKGGAIYETFRDAVRDSVGEGAAMVLPSGCRALAMVLRDGLTAREEGFCDRAYRPDGGLVARTRRAPCSPTRLRRRRRHSAWPAARWWPSTARC